MASKPDDRRSGQAELERAKIAFLAARTPYARRKALRRLEQLRARGVKA